MPLKGSLESIPHLTATDKRIGFLIFMKDKLELDGVRQDWQTRSTDSASDRQKAEPTQYGSGQRPFRWLTGSLSSGKTIWSLFRKNYHATSYPRLLRTSPNAFLEPVSPWTSLMHFGFSGIDCTHSINSFWSAWAEYPPST